MVSFQRDERIARPRTVTLRMAGIALSGLCLLGACVDGDDHGGHAGHAGEAGHAGNAGSAGHAGNAGNAGSAGNAGDGNGGLPIVPCPEDLTFSIPMEARSRDGLLGARLVDATPAPPEKFRNDWTVEILDADGEPVADAVIDEAEPFMPAHNHDGTFPPDVSALEEPGRFQIDRLNLWMGGPWEVRLWVSGAGAEDYLVFDVCVME